MRESTENPKARLYILGSNKLKSEVESCKKIPSDKRVFFVNFKMNDHGEGEPQLDEEVIEADYKD